LDVLLHPKLVILNLTTDLKCVIVMLYSGKRQVLSA
jgi:hypothetical protein